jgi:two-component system phosphate regulon sensor histidine kinase PhoR
LDGWLLAGAIGAVAISALAPRGRDRKGQLQVTSEGGTVQRSGAAEALLATIPDPVILVNRRAIVIETNEAAHLLLPGLKLKNPLSFALRSPDVLDGIDEVLATGEMRKVEYSERVPTERTFEVQIGPLRTDSPQAGVVLFFRDLTSARRLEHMRVDFVANASHELRTPLASLLGFIETLQGPARNDPKARERFLEIMRVQAQRMTRLIDDLLSLSRIEMRAHVAPESPVDLSPIVAQIVDALTPLARERGVEIHWAGPAGPFWVLGDRDELLRVTENLVENAIKYGESGGRVDMSLSKRPGPINGREQVELCIRDYGPGIAPEHLPRLTERFYRADVAHSREKGGTGLGLAIVKHIVNRHRGQLTIESEPGAGALFRVTLPATNAHKRVTA